MRTRIDFDLEDIQRAAQLRRIGRDLYDQASAISPSTVEAMAAVAARLAGTTDYGRLLAEGFGEAMVSEAVVRHLDNT